MKKKAAITALVLMCAIFVVGLVFIFTAPAIGQNAGQGEIIRGGGFIDTHRYERTINSVTIAFTVGGTVLSLVGGTGILISGCVVLRELD